MKCVFHSLIYHFLEAFIPLHRNYSIYDEFQKSFQHVQCIEYKWLLPADHRPANRLIQLVHLHFELKYGWQCPARPSPVQYLQPHSSTDRHKTIARAAAFPRTFPHRCHVSHLQHQYLRPFSPPSGKQNFNRIKKNFYIVLGNVFAAK